MMEAALSAVLKCSLAMAAITLICAALSPVFSRRYAPRWRYLIWLGVAFGWFLPLRPALELPLLPAIVTQTLTAPAMRSVAAVPAGNIPAEAMTIITSAGATTPNIPAWAVAAGVWLAGLILMLGFHAVRHLRFMKLARRWSETVIAPGIPELLNRLKDDLGIRRAVGLKTCAGIASPMLVGLIHPVILLPPASLTTTEWAMILRHELVHLKRQDLLFKALTLVATALHWFNPAVYLMARAAQLACEIACDAQVLQGKDTEARLQYGETILAVVRGTSASQTALSTNFYGGKRDMKNRIASLLDGSPKKTGILLLCFILAAISLTGATIVPAKALPEITQPDSETTNETRRTPRATEEDYRSLLKLRTADYRDRTLADFNADLLEWTIENTGRMERILEDTDYGAPSVKLLPDEWTFVCRTVRYSSDENAEMIRSLQTGEPERGIDLRSNYGPSFVRPGESMLSGFWMLSFQGSYHIHDREKITVKERDRTVVAMTDQFWGHFLDDFMSPLSGEDVRAALERDAAQLSNGRITISIALE